VTICQTIAPALARDVVLVTFPPTPFAHQGQARFCLTVLGTLEQWVQSLPTDRPLKPASLSPS
jgi:hypothetical protein